MSQFFHRFCKRISALPSRIIFNTTVYLVSLWLRIPQRAIRLPGWILQREVKFRLLVRIVTVRLEPHRGSQIHARPSQRILFRHRKSSGTADLGGPAKISMKISRRRQSLARVVFQVCFGWRQLKHHPPPPGCHVERDGRILSRESMCKRVGARWKATSIREWGWCQRNYGTVHR